MLVLMGYLAVRQRKRTKSIRKGMTDPLHENQKEHPFPLESSEQEADFSEKYTPEFRWFLENKDKIPSSPFYLGSHRFIADSEKYIAYLEVELSQGISNPRYRTGSMQAEIEALRKLISA